MGDYNDVRSRNIMSLSIYHFLENLLAAVNTSETLTSEANDRDQLSNSKHIKPGGYPEEIFIFLSEREKEEYMCSVCYSVLNDVHQCSNGHKFCYSCIYMWSGCNRPGADCCPVCRCDGIYAKNEQLTDKINRKRVKCHDEGCNWRGFLRDYMEHEHRHYEFKEISRSTELPSLKGIVTTSSESLATNKSILNRSLNSMEPFPFSTTDTSLSTARPSVAPRRLPSLYESRNEHLTIASSPRDIQSPLLPPIRNHTQSVSPTMNYQRLVPTYASRRNNFGLFHDGHEHLATILILLTSDLEDRVINTSTDNSGEELLIDSSTNQRTNNFAASSINSNRPSNGNEAVVYHNFRNLNSQSSDVSNVVLEGASQSDEDDGVSGVSNSRSSSTNDSSIGSNNCNDSSSSENNANDTE